MTWLATERTVGRIGAQAASFLITRAIMLVTTVAVARTAGVEQYGIFALAMIAFQGGLLLRDAGLGQALIVDGQRRGMGWPAFLTISAVGIAVAVAMVVVTGLVAAFLALPTLGELARILALAFTIGSFGVTSNALLERSLRFKARAWIDIAAYTTLGIVTAVGLWSGQGVSSLAWGYVGHAVVLTLVALVLAPPWEDRGGELREFAHVARYGALLWAAAGLSYLAANLDNALTGLLGGAAALGYYALAYTIGTTITIGPAQVLNRVALPYYGRSRTEPDAILRTLGTVVPLSIGLGLIPAAAIAWLAPEIVRIVVPSGLPAQPIVILAIYGVVRAGVIALGTAANGIGAARHTVGSSLLNVAVMIVTIPPAFAIAGVAGVAVAVTAAISFAAIHMTWGLERRTGLIARRHALVAVLLTATWLGAGLAAVGQPLSIRLVCLAGTWLVGLVVIVRAMGITRGSMRAIGTPP